MARARPHGAHLAQDLGRCCWWWCRGQHVVPRAHSSRDTHPGTPTSLPDSHLFSLMMRFETKSLASSEMLSKVSSSKYQLAARTLLSVSVSLSPRKGERPLSLRMQGSEELGALRLCHLQNPPGQSKPGLWVPWGARQGEGRWHVEVLHSCLHLQARTPPIPPSPTCPPSIWVPQAHMWFGDSSRPGGLCPGSLAQCWQPPGTP